eukprot:TRINITY_DN15291_c0_g1_i1.p1 TRINITY_DN15291_c0_g1~~TRINITY_DN15291_c0_g1_i1.p1  ORF type:complete len:146 (+),score=14.50 TRINITY_DN15291_c0_g1_i1:97-534(+)
MGLHPLSRLLYRRLLQVAATHPTVGIDEVREIAKVEFARRGSTNDKELLQRAIAYGRTQLRHLRNGAAAFEVSQGGAEKVDWHTRNNQLLDDINKGKAPPTQRYISLKNTHPHFRGTIPANSRSFEMIGHRKVSLLGPAQPKISK